ELGFDFGNHLGEPAAIQFIDRRRAVRQHGETVFRDLGDAAEHDDLDAVAAGDDGQDAGTQRGHDRSMTGQHAEIAFRAGNVDLIDLAGEGELFRRYEIEVEGGHIEPANGE